MNIHEQKQGAVTVIKPEGPLVEEDLPMFRGRIEEIRRVSVGRFVLDCSAVPFVDSRGLETLVEISERMSQVGQSLRVCGVNETLREVLDITELSSMFEHYDDVHGAVRSFL